MSNMNINTEDVSFATNVCLHLPALWNNDGDLWFVVRSCWYVLYPSQY